MINEGLCKYYYLISYAYIFYLLGITTSEELKGLYKNKRNIDDAFYSLYEKIMNDQDLRELRLLVIK